MDRMDASSSHEASKNLIKNTTPKKRRRTHSPIDDTQQSSGNVTAIKSERMSPPSKSILEIKTESTTVRQDDNHEEIADLLKTVIRNQDLIVERLSALERYIKSENTEHKKELYAQSKQVRENLALSRETLKATNRILGENFDETETEIASRLPMSSIADIIDMEEHLQVTEFNNSMRTYLFKLKGTSHNVDYIFRRIISDQCVQEFNWDGRCGKGALKTLYLFDKILFDMFQTTGRKDYESQMRKSVELAHNRWKQLKRKASQSTETI